MPVQAAAEAETEAEAAAQRRRQAIVVFVRIVAWAADDNSLIIDICRGIFMA